MFVLNRDHFREIGMHQDQRIGLALGVLLIGACAAFFFRNETVEVSNSPRLQHAQELDDRIAERSTRPYLKGIEVVEAADRARTRTVADHQSEAEDVDEDHARGFWSPSDSTAGKKPAGSRKPRASLSETESDVEELDPIPVPGDHTSNPDDGHRNETSTRQSATDSKSDAGPNEGATPVVQKGETLSSIAAKRLGSPNRYRELFQANQDQLNDVNDLKSGMTLRIPQGQTASQSKSSQTKPRSSDRSEASINSHSTSVVDLLNDSDPSKFQRSSPAPRVEVLESTSDQGPSLQPTQPKTQAPVESQGNDSVTPTRKFQPSRRFLMPSRPQARTNEASAEKTSG